jgi:hypothetical protein
VNENLAYLKTFAQLPLALCRFARHTLTLEEAERIVGERMAHRDERFLEIVERGIYGHPSSPYLALLQGAGCELDDLRALVRGKGLEGALRALREAGVYVTYEEFKGRKPIVRNGKEIRVTAWDFDNPRARHHLPFQTGGSTGAASKVGVDVDQMAARAPCQMLAFAAHDVLGAPSAAWGGILPHSKIGSMLRRAHIGQLPQRWFSPIGWRDSKHWLKYGLGTAYILLCMRLCGIRVPLPRVVRGEQALVVARWMAEALRAHGRCLLYTQVSYAVRVCLAAREAGLDLTGATIKAGGEPATPAKVRHIESSGARYMSSYGMTEAGSIAAGCARPLDGSDVHLFKDAYALFAHPYTVPGIGVTVPAFNLTTLLPTAPKLMLNVQMDDYGLIEERQCGCGLETYGYTTHLRQIRSYSKLTGEGATLLGTEMVRILEDVLPARFGGSPLDYQMMEDEDEQGFTRLSLVISPRVGTVDESAAIQALLDALRQSSPMADAARTLWQPAGTIRVKRMEPTWTGRGKLLPLHIQRRAADPPDPSPKGNP